MAEEVDEFGIPIRKAQAANVDEFGIPFKKKAVSLPSSTGGIPQLNGSKSFLNPLQPQQPTDLTPVPNPQVKQEVRANQVEQVIKQNKPIQDFYNQLTPEARQRLDAVNQSGQNRPNDALREPTREETDHYNFMQTPIGKTLGAVAYVGSKATKGTLAVAKGAAHLANLGLNATNPERMAQVEEGTDKGFAKADKAADFGLTPTDKSNYDDSKPISALGMAAEFAPTVAMGEAVSAPKVLMYLQGVGQGKDLADNIEKGGAKLNPIAKEALIQGSGAVNLLLTDIFKGNAVSSSLQDKVITGIAADALKESAGKDITIDSFKKLLENKAQDFAQRFERAPIEALGHYNETAKTFAKLNAGNFAVHQAVDKLNDTPVFNENLGDLATNTQKTLTEDAPIFAAVPAIKEASKLFPNSGYHNDVVDAIIKNPSPENVDAIKNKLYEHGFDQNNPNQWTPEEMDATYKHIDKIADATRSLPSTIRPDKHADAIGLVMGRNDLQEQLSSLQEAKKSLDPAIQDIPTGKEQYLTDKIDQANDKLRGIVSGVKPSYSKGTGDDEGKFFKKTGDKLEEITPQRYALETTERDAHNSIPVEDKKSDVITDEQKAKLPTPEEHAANNAETDKKIADFQAKFPDHKFDPLDDLPADVARTFDWVDSDVPIADPKKAQEASDWLYNKYKQLTTMKGSDTRRLTLEQIDSYQKQLESDISLLDDYVKKHHPDYEKPTEEIKPTEQAVASANDRAETSTEKLVEPKAEPVKEEPKPVEVPESIKEGDDYKLANETGKVTRVKELDNGDTQLKVKKADDTHETVIVPKETVSKKESVDPIREKAIDAVNHGIIHGEGVKFDGYTARLDLDMPTKDRDKAVRDIKKGDYETAPAKKMLSTIARFEANDDYPFIEGTGDKAIRRSGMTSEEVQQHIDEAKSYELAKEQDIEKNNKRLADLGITHEDIQSHQNYERERSTGERSTGKRDNGRPVEVPTGDAQRTEDVKAERTAPDKSSEATQGSPRAGDKLREVADKIREGKIKKLGSFKSHTPASLVWDGSLEAVAKAIDGGAKIADAIQKGVEHIKASDWYKGLSKERQDEIIDEYIPHMEQELSEPKQEPEGNEVKKTILTKRAYEGTVSEDVKKYLEDKGLTRSSFSPEERSKQATDFINKFGEEAAYMAVEAGDIDGGMAASVLAQLQIRNSGAMDAFAIGSEERDDLAQKQADYIALAEKKGYYGGEFNGQLAYEYQNKQLDYAGVKRQVEKLTGKKLTPEQELRVKKLTSDNEALKKKLKDAEAKLIDETDKEFSQPKPKVAKEKPPTQYAQKALDAIGKVRSKIKANSYSDATGMVALVDTALATIEAGIKTGMTVSRAIEKGVEHIKTELAKRGIDLWDKEDDFRKDVTEAFADEGIDDKQADRDKLERSNIKRLEKELDNAKNDRIKKSPTKREFSEEENDLKEQIRQEKLRIKLKNLQEDFVDKTDNTFTHDEAKDIWDYMKDRYINQGTSYRDAISKTSDDLGLSWRQISEAITTPKNKRISDEMWKAQSDQARNMTVIKDWIGDQNKSPAMKLLNKVSGAFRGVAVFGHGGIFMGTHAGMTLFNPTTWNKTVPAFFRGWKYAYGNEGDYNRYMEELKNSQNYVIAQRAGLKNNPDRMNNEEYQKSQKFLGKLGTAGERGFNAVKVLRQDLFDYHFNRLTPAERDDPATAVSMAHLINLATGATNANIPKWVNELTFAGGMEASRWEKLTASPYKASETALKAIFAPSKATTAEKVFAKVWARRVGEQLATFTSILAANAAIQNTLNPTNKVNMTNPNKPDFLKFKFGDMTIDPTSGMRGVGMFMYTLGKIPFETKKELRGDKRIAVLGKDVAGYARGKLSPFYGTAADVFSNTDFNGNVMPYSKEKPNKGKHRLGYGEYGTSKLPLPVAEAFNVYYKSALDHGAHKKTMDDILKGILAGGISGTTGFRVGEYDAHNKK